MSTIADFIEVRQSIEALAKQITLCVEKNELQDSPHHLHEAKRQLELLTTMVDNDVQVIVAGRLSRHLTGLGTKVDKMVAKLPKGRKPTAKKLISSVITPDNTEAPEIVIFERP